MSEQDNAVSRRSLLLGAAIGGVGLAGGSSLVANAATKAQQRLKEIFDGQLVAGVLPETRLRNL